MNSSTFEGTAVEDKQYLFPIYSIARIKRRKSNMFAGGIKQLGRRLTQKLSHFRYESLHGVHAFLKCSFFLIGKVKL